VPWTSTYLLPPGVPQDISVTVNGVPAASNCTGSTFGLPAIVSGAPALGNEPQSFTTPDGACQYVFSSYLEARVSWLALNRTAGGAPLLTVNGTGGPQEQLEHPGLHACMLPGCCVRQVPDARCCGSISGRTVLASSSARPGMWT
jgi:hypothetical protein